MNFLTNKNGLVILKQKPKTTLNFSQKRLSKGVAFLIYSQDNFTAEGQIDYDHLLDFYSLLSQAYAQNRNEDQLNKSELDILKAIAEGVPGIAQIKARNILSFFYGIEYNPEFNVPVGGSGGALMQAHGDQEYVSDNKDKKEQALEKAEVHLSPNPVDNNLTINYNSPSIYGNSGSIKVVDTVGKVYFEGIIDDQQEEFTLNTSNWLIGVYYAVYTNQNGRQKLIPFVVYH